MSQNLRKGLRFEDQACRYLKTRGLTLLNSNYRCRHGEIDLIMRDNETLCFIEVKFRNSLQFGGAAGAISVNKQRKLVKTALYYMASHRHCQDQPLRFDAFLIQQQFDGRNRCNWIQNAFYAE